MYVNGVSQGHLTGIRVVDYDGVGHPHVCPDYAPDDIWQPITDVTSNGIHRLIFPCNLQHMIARQTSSAMVESTHITPLSQTRPSLSPLARKSPQSGVS